MKLQNKGFIQLLLVNFIWGGSYTFAKLALKDVGPLYLIALTNIIGSIILSLVFYKHLKKANKNSVICGLVTGTLVTVGTLFVNIGLQYTTSVKAGLFNSMELITIPFILWIVYRDKFDVNSFLSILCALMGIVLINYNGITFSFNVGDLLCAIGPMFFAVQLITLSRFAKDDEVQITVIELLIVGLISGLGALIFEDIPPQVSNVSLYSILYLGIISGGIAYYLETVALKNIKPTHAGVINTIMPVFTMVISYFILGETLNMVSMIGSIFIILALINFNIKIIDRLINNCKQNSMSI